MRKCFTKKMRDFYALFTTILFFIGACWPVFSQQIYINEVQSSNVSTLKDHLGNTPDWIELYNAGDDPIDLAGYGLSDTDSSALKWTFPATVVYPQTYLTVFASGLDLHDPGLYWETVIDLGERWKYLVPQSEPSGLWRNPGFDDTAWLEGKSGFGYGDFDDSTEIDNTVSVFIRRSFVVTDKDRIEKAFLHMDYDDGFVAYLNGKEIARAGVGISGQFTAFDERADSEGHEALMHQGGDPEAFAVDSVAQFLENGENVLAIQVHNVGENSSDLTAIPIFTVGKTSPSSNSGITSEFISLNPVRLHTNFKISSTGEPIILSNSSEEKIDSVLLIPMHTDISYGRKPDGNGAWFFYNEPTPGQSNTTKAYAPFPLDSVAFSKTGGFSDSAFQLELETADAVDSIYYSLDGSDPGKEDFLYGAPITISQSSVVRARVVRSGHLPGPVSDQTYFIKVSKDLPIVSIITDPDNLWDNEYGIYVKGDHAEYDFPFFGSNFWKDWERPANISMYEPDGSLAFQLNAGIKIFGNYSRGNEQKSISVHARKAYGAEAIKYKIFEDKDISSFETIILRNSGNDFNNTMMRDGLCVEIVKGLNLEYQAYRPAVVFINGAYWGIQNIREKVNEEFLAANCGADEDNTDILENFGEIVRGQADEYIQLIQFLETHSLADNENYEYVKNHIDIENFINYQIAEIFIDNRDWPGNNIKYWKERSPGSKWRWILFDSDFGLNIWSDDNQAFNTLAFAAEENGPEWPNPPWSTLLFRKLLQNTSFKNDFINAFADNLNTIFKPNVTKGLLEKLKKRIEPEISSHLQRWDGSKWYWDNRISAMNSFLGQRSAYVTNHIKSQFGIASTFNITINKTGEGYIRLNTLNLYEFPFNGSYFGNIPVKIMAVPEPGYRFVRWEGIETADREELILTANSATILTAVFEPADISPKDIVINEINYNSSDEWDAGDWIELYNLADFNVNISAWEIKDKNDDHSYVIPDGTVIQSHGFLVICNDRKKFSSLYPNVPITTGALGFGLGSDGDCVRLFNETGDLSDEVCYEVNVPWPAKPNGGGASLSLYNALSNNAHPRNWVASVGTGTPGKPNDVVTGLGNAEAFNADLSTKVYPNPLGRRAVLEISGDEGEKVTVTVFDISGKRTILEQSYTLSEGWNSRELDLSNAKYLSSGIYILQLASQKRKEYIKLMIGE